MRYTRQVSKTCIIIPPQVMCCYFENGKGDVLRWTLFECDTRTRTWTSHEYFINEICNKKQVKHNKETMSDKRVDSQIQRLHNQTALPNLQETHHKNEHSSHKQLNQTLWNVKIFLQNEGDFIQLTEPHKKQPN